MMIISSLQNPRVKDTVRLRRRRDRDREGLVLIEGYRETRRALESGWPITTLFLCPEMYQGENEPALAAACANAGAAILQTTATVFRKMAYRDRPEGILAVGLQRQHTLEQLQPGPAPLLLIAEAIEKPGNLGTMLRSADAVGADGIVVCDPRTDLYNPNVVRASTGMLFSVPTAVAAAEATLKWLRQRRILTVAASPHASQLYTDADFTGPVAVAVGAEQYGLSPTWLETADIRVRIPMRGRADSLNVATAAALLLYEVLRQRGSEAAIPPQVEDCDGAKPVQ